MESLNGMMAKNMKENFTTASIMALVDFHGIQPNISKVIMKMV